MKTRAGFDPQRILAGQIAPSLLSADFSRLESEILSVEQAGVAWLHVDVMDGHFVPNLTIGPLVVEAIRPRTESVLDCHLMVEKPEFWIEGFAKAGADIITVHSEATRDLPGLLKKIRAQGCRAGVSIKPKTPVSAIDPVLDQVDLVLVMSVEPGFGGQKFMSESLPKVEELKKKRTGSRAYWIEIDGGIGSSTIASARRAGVDVFVAGSAVFGQADRRASIQTLEKAMHA